jgi:hypothetical protein
MENIALTGIFQIFNRLVDDIYDYSKTKLKKEINKELLKRRIPNLIQKELNHVRMVKTLWQVDRAVNIDDFYCDSHLIAPLKRSNKENRILIRNLDDFPTTHNLVIRGIAGQGKSIFLRYLCIREFEAGKRIPIFIELRRIQPDETLQDHIFRFFETLELSIDQELFTFIAESGKFVFFLDAFDEIDLNISQKLINEIENLVSVFPNCRFIITTRPNSAIEMSPLFDIWTLDDLRDREYENVIKKLADSPANAEIIIKRIKSNKSSVSELLCTPLMVTLLLISYKSYQKIPEQLSDFYESIFFVLLQRHDGTKPGFTRFRRCLLNDNQYREIFNALCYETKKTAKSSYDSQTICKLVKSSMLISTTTEDPEKYLKDIVNITCLILMEGDEYRFIHRSVQEYYSATFIKSRPDSALIRFYNACLNYAIWNIWHYEISFLAEIDKYRYNKYFVLPLCRKWLSVDSDDELLVGCPPMNIQRAKNIIGDIDIGFDLKRLEHPQKSVGVGHISQVMENHVVTQLFRLDYTGLIKSLQSGQITININLFLYKIRHTDKTRPVITVSQIIDEGFLVPELLDFAQKLAGKIYEDWKHAYEYTTKQESLDIATDILSGI